MDKAHFIPDPHLTTALTPPASWYIDPAMLELEKQRVLRSTWQYATSLDLLRLPGNYATVDVIVFSDTVQNEDIQICEDVWRNLGTGVSQQGRYSVKRENGVHHFHSLMAEFLAK